MSIATLITDGFGSFGDIAHIIRLGLDAGNATPPPASSASGGFFFGNEGRRHRTVQEERELLGIFPKKVKKLIKRIAKETVVQEKTDQQAEARLERELARLQLTESVRYKEALERERDRLIALDIQRYFLIAKKMQDEEEERDIEMLLLM